MSDKIPVKVKMRHIRQAKMCSKGARAFIERHGLDYSEFLKNGLDSELLEATGDSMAMKCVEAARGEQ